VPDAPRPVRKRSAVATFAPLTPPFGPALVADALLVRVPVRLAAQQARDRRGDQYRTPRAGDPDRPEVDELPGGQDDRAPDRDVDEYGGQPGAPDDGEPAGYGPRGWDRHGRDRGRGRRRG